MLLCWSVMLLVGGWGGMYELRFEAALSSAKRCLLACDLGKLISRVERSCDQKMSEVQSTEYSSSCHFVSV
jgi:hypothetical protein